MTRWLKALGLAAAACGATPKLLDQPIVRGTGAPSGEHETAAAEAARRFADRLDEKALLECIAAARRAVTLVDSDVASYTLLAHALFFYADDLLALDPARKAEMIRALEEGAAFAERGLRALSPSFEKIRQAGGGVDQAALGLGKEAAPLLYWWALSHISWANAQGMMTAMGVYKEVFRVVEMVGRLDETYDHAGPARFFGAARAEAPSIAGGSVDESRRHFARAVELAPDFLPTRYAIARYLATRTGDRKLYEDTLRFIAQTPSGRMPDVLPEQEIAKKKAKLLPPWRD